MAPERRHTLTQRGRRRNLRRSYLAAISAAFVLELLTTPLSAQTEADRATARSLAAEGSRALQDGDYETAEDRFRRADELVHAPTLVVDHARALVGLGRLVEAHERYELVVREGVPANSPVVWNRALEDAERELAALKPRLAWLVVYVDAPAEAHVSVDTSEVPSAALGVPRATNPGSRSITASAPGYLTQEVQVDLAEGERRELRFTLEADPSVVTQEESDTSRTPLRPKSTVEPEDSLLMSQRTWAYVSLGVGAAGLIGGGVTGVLFLRAGADLDKRCPANRCDGPKEDFQDDVDRYRQLGWASGIGLGVGVAAFAAGAYLYLTDDSEADGTAGEDRGLHPLVACDSVGVWGRF